MQSIRSLIHFIHSLQKIIFYSFNVFKRSFLSLFIISFFRLKNFFLNASHFKVNFSSGYVSLDLLSSLIYFPSFSPSNQLDWGVISLIEWDLFQGFNFLSLKCSAHRNQKKEAQRFRCIGKQTSVPRIIVFKHHHWWRQTERGTSRVKNISIAFHKQISFFSGPFLRVALFFLLLVLWESEFSEWMDCWMDTSNLQATSTKLHLLARQKMWPERKKKSMSWLCCKRGIGGCLKFHQLMERETIFNVARFFLSLFSSALFFFFEIQQQ